MNPINNNTTNPSPPSLPPFLEPTPRLKTIPLPTITASIQSRHGAMGHGRRETTQGVMGIFVFYIFFNWFLLFYLYFNQFKCKKEGPIFAMSSLNRFFTILKAEPHCNKFPNIWYFIVKIENTGTNTTLG